MKCEIRLPGFCLAMCLCVLVPAAARGADLAEYRSRAYRITTDLPRDMIQEIGRHMDLVFSEYSRRFSGFAVRNPPAQPLYVFGAERDYLEFLRSRRIDGSGSHGMFFVTEAGSGLAAFLEGQSIDRLLHTLRHEGFHQFAHSRIGPTLPIWANEGLAEYFAAAIIVNGRLEPGQISVDRVFRIKESLRDNRFIALPTLLTMTSDDWSRNVRAASGDMQYLQSWSIVHFLVNGDDERYQSAFAHYLQLVSRGMDSDTAFHNAFGRNSYDAFEARWKRHLITLQATPEFTAAQRLEFLAQGMLFLRERGRSFESLDQLQDQLKSSQFAVRQTTSDGLTIEFKSRDVENFQPPPARRGRSTLELVPSKDENLPPGLLVKGLRVPVRLTWRADESERLVSRVVYE